jgi:hypothetical protein
MEIGKNVKDLLYLCVHKSIARNGGVSEFANYEVCQMVATLNSYVRNTTRDSVYEVVWDSIEWEEELQITWK